MSTRSSTRVIVTRKHIDLLEKIVNIVEAFEVPNQRTILRIAHLKAKRDALRHWTGMLKWTQVHVHPHSLIPELWRNSIRSFADELKTKRYEQVELNVIKKLYADHKKSIQQSEEFLKGYTVFHTTDGCDKISETDMNYLREEFINGEVYIKDGKIVQILCKSSGSPCKFNEEERKRLDEIVIKQKES
jgi:hypothetical protein